MEAGSPGAAASLRRVMPDREREISFRAMTDDASDTTLGERVDQIEAAASGASSTNCGSAATRPEHRPDGARGLLPQLSVPLVPRGG
jgi:hypothetical protein